MNKTILIVAIIAIAAAGCGAYYFMGQSSVPDAQELPTPDSNENMESGVDPYEYLVSPTDIDSDSSDISDDELRKELWEIFKSKEYQNEVKRISSTTEKALEPVVSELDKSYAELNNWIEANLSEIKEGDYTGRSWNIGSVGDYKRVWDDHVITYMVKTLQATDSIKKVQGAYFDIQFKEWFPKVTELYRSKGHEPTYENLYVHLPANMSSWDLREASTRDSQRNEGNYTIDRFVTARYPMLREAYSISNEFQGYMDNLESLLTESQSAEFHKILDKCNGLYEEYISEIENYNKLIRELQINKAKQRLGY